MEPAVAARPTWVVVLLNLFTVLIGAYGLSVSGFILLRFSFGEPLGLFGLVSSYLHLLIMPSLALLPVALLTPNRWLAVTLVIPCGLFMVTYGRQFFPSRVDVTADAPRITILTFNLNNGNESGERVAEVIRRAQADLVAVQELNSDMAETLADLYPYRAFYPRSDFAGQGVLSRYPITAAETWETESLQGRFQLDMDGATVTLLNVHAAYPYVTRLRFDGTQRSQDVSEILRRAAGEAGPLLIVGDFNMTDMAADYGRLAARFTDAYRQVGAGMGFTFPAHTDVFGLRNVPPLARIDFIFHSPHFQAVEARVGGDAAGSDHFPLFASLALGAPR
jgi:vancomycin resistance protein VanJ